MPNKKLKNAEKKTKRLISSVDKGLKRKTPLCAQTLRGYDNDDVFCFVSMNIMATLVLSGFHALAQSRRKVNFHLLRLLASACTTTIFAF